MRMVLGLDGGGTKTECVLMDETHKILARGRSGPSNPMRVGFDEAFAAVREAAEVAIGNGEITRGEIRALCAGLAGVAQPDSEKRMKELLANEFPGKFVHVCTDLDLTLEAAGNGPVIVLIAGTGSAAVGRGGDGRVARIGGHGFLLGDEGSAFHIGQRAATEALRRMDAGEPEIPLAKRFLQQLGMADWQEFRLRVYDSPDEVFPRIFPVVAAAAEEGDPTARSLLQEAAGHLAELVSALVTRLGLETTTFSLVKTGGMIGRSNYFDELMDERLRTVAPCADLEELAMSEAEAAACIALRLSDKAANEGN
jgi:N-acetylglucosamine kinase-like BadF-type ATPase